MKRIFFILAVLALTSLQGVVLALDLRLAAVDGDDELFIPKAAIQFIQQADGKLRIGTLTGNFKITPIIIEGRPGVDGLMALNSAIHELLELEEPRDPGELLNELNDLEAAEQGDLTSYRWLRLSLFITGNGDTVKCAAIEQL